MYIRFLGDMHFDLNLLVESDLNEVCGKLSKLKFAIVESDLNCICGSWSKNDSAFCTCGKWSKLVLRKVL